MGVLPRYLVHFQMLLSPPSPIFVTTGQSEPCCQSPVVKVPATAKIFLHPPSDGLTRAMTLWALHGAMISSRKRGA